MPLTLAEFTQFKKLMNLTTSPNDAEALAALRKANTILDAHKATWELVLNRVLRVEAQIESGEDNDMEDVFEKALERSSGTFRDLVNDIYNQWETKRTISPRQREIVLKAAGII